MLSRLRSYRPGHGTVVGYLALFIALGGTSWAVATGSIGSREIKNNTIRSKDVRNGTLLLRDFRASERAKLRGPQGLPGPQGPRGTTDIVYVDSAVVSVPVNESRTATATCPSGSQPTGGGLGFGTDASLLGVAFHTVAASGFSVTAHNYDTVNNVAHNIQARVACARE